MPNDEHAATQHKAVLVGLWRHILSFGLGVIVAAYVVGGASQKVSALVAWKEAVAPKIDRIDSVGSLSFDHFYKTYTKDQARNDERLKELEREMKEVQKHSDP